MAQRGSDNVFRFRRLKWAAPKTYKVLPDDTPPPARVRQRHFDTVTLLLAAVIGIALIATGILVADDITETIEHAIR